MELNYQSHEIEMLLKKMYHTPGGCGEIASDTAWKLAGDWVELYTEVTNQDAAIARLDRNVCLVHEINCYLIAENNKLCGNNKALILQNAMLRDRPDLPADHTVAAKKIRS